MQIILDTDIPEISKHYIETLVLLYLPMEKFGENDMDSTLFVSVKGKDGRYLGNIVYNENGNEYKEELSLPKMSESGYPISPKSFTGKLFISLFGKIFSYYPPWGMLTGVRPARFALDIMEKGNSADATKRVLCENYLCTPEKAALAVDVASFDKKLFESNGDNKAYSLYIGIPFCPSRCRYCSFVSYSTDNLLSLLPEYISTLCDETEMLVKTANCLGLKLESIYVGGGTPTVLDEKLLCSFLTRLKDIIGDTGGVEFTFEAGRPDTVTKEKLLLLKQSGVTRVSINTQTTNDDILLSVGRRHTYADYLYAYGMAKEMGFFVNTDLIAGLPDESVESFKRSIDDIIGVSPDNITVHSFSLKKSSEYTVCGGRLDPKDKGISEMLSYSSKRMNENGYYPYYMYRQKNTGGNFENVGYTKDGKGAALYNVYMMEGLHTVLASGAGASTKLVSQDLSDTEKIYNPKYPFEYLRDKDNILKHGQKICSFYENRYSKK